MREEERFVLVSKGPILVYATRRDRDASLHLVSLAASPVFVERLDLTLKYETPTRPRHVDVGLDEVPTILNPGEVVSLLNHETLMERWERASTRYVGPMPSTWLRLEGRFRTVDGVADVGTDVGCAIGTDELRLVLESAETPA